MLQPNYYANGLCVECQQPFRRTRPGTLVCSPECKAARHRRQVKEQSQRARERADAYDMVSKQCVVCHAWFQTTVYQTNLHKCPACRAAKPASKPVVTTSRGLEFDPGLARMALGWLKRHPA